MINPQSLDLSSLPWLPLDVRLAFPRQPAIYFAIDSQDCIQYIGRSIDPKHRWSQHHRYEALEQIGSVRIAYLFVDAVELLPSVEAALIEWFNPPLNVMLRRSPLPFGEDLRKPASLVTAVEKVLEDPSKAGFRSVEAVIRAMGGDLLLDWMPKDKED